MTKPFQSSAYKYSLNSPNLVSLSSTTEILSLGLTLHIYLIILVSFLSGLITSFFLTGQVSTPYSIALRTHAEYNLAFVPKANLYLLTKALNL